MSQIDDRPADADEAARWPVDAKERSQQFGPARADQTREADNLAGADRKSQPMPRVRRGAQTFDLQHRPASLVRRAHIELGQIAPDHEPYHVVVGDLGARQFAGVLPIPQHRDPVGDFLHFAEPSARP